MPILAIPAVHVSMCCISPVAVLFCACCVPLSPCSPPLWVVTHAATCCRVRRHATPCDGVRRCTSSPPILPPPRCCDLAPSSCFVFLFGLRSSSSRSSSFFSPPTLPLGKSTCGVFHPGSCSSISITHSCKRNPMPAYNFDLRLVRHEGLA
jgi:hypothetical protein